MSIDLKKLAAPFPAGDVACWTQQILSDCKKRVDDDDAVQQVLESCGVADSVTLQ